ncbi:Beta-galactosidase (Beta-gal) (Lactase) [Durusdinium trenchii]|uniref:Beta-galactosidase (Beta-gal) (Lactase) n=1 Tax=Durusdinium trenchii TaxID=1381693 RepID=A0ABP0IVC5_9DINO
MRGAALPFFTLLASASPAERPPYPHYPGRRVVTLEGPWDFAYLGDVPLAAGAFIREEEFQGTRLVPDAFNDREWLCPLQQCPQWPTHPCHRCCHALRTGSAEPSCDRALPQCCDPVGLGRRGVAAYRIYLEPEVSLLHFRGCGLRCAVLLDRTSVAEHEGSYSPFWVDLAGLPWPSGPRAPRELLVLADSRFGTLQRLHFDWLQPGGILRPVEAHRLEESSVRIRHLAVEPKSVTHVLVSLDILGCESGGTLLARLHFSGLETPRERRLDCLGATSTPTAPSARVAQSAAWLETLGPGAGVWTSERPELQMLMVQLMLDGRQVDAITVRFGLRWLEAKEQQLWLNGAPLQLRGVNRHESWVWGGLHRPWAELQEDIQLLLELNANFVRGAHYSQDQRFLDLCDENGILVWEETSAWQPSSEDLADPVFMALQAQALRETIEASANHPSVIIFGFLNEADASEPTVARPAFARLAQLARQMGQGRLVAWASRHKIRDVTLDLGDLIAFNDYPGWYDASVLEIPSVWESYADWARATHPGKPLLIAEAGAGGLAGWHGRPGEEDLWSEELQASIVGATLSAALAAGYIGVALWQFADVRVDGALYWSERPTAEEEEGLPEVLVNVSSGAEWMERVAVVYQSINNLFGQHRPLRPRELNNKGLLSLSRQHKKLAFYAAQDAFRPCVPLVPGQPLPPEQEQLFMARADREEGCPGCFLAVHTWNVADRPPDEPGVRVHGHQLDSRAGHWSLRRGLLRLAGHVDGRLSGVGGFLSVSGARDATSSSVAVREAALSLWRWEPVAAPNANGHGASERPFLLRVIAGPRCGAVLSLSGAVPRDEKSVYATVQLDPSLGTLFWLQPT